MTDRCGLCFALLLAIAGCGSSPPVDYYALQPISGSASVTDATGAPVLGLGPLVVPGYLDRPELVTQLAGSEMRVDQFNRWAEPLGVALPRVVAANVDQLVDSVVVISFPYGAKVRTDYRLLGKVVRFDADQAGQAVLEVQWNVLDADGNYLLAPRRDRYAAQAASPGSSASVVSALNATVDAFSRDIAARLTAALH